jgi:hypothetical protein
MPSIFEGEIMIVRHIKLLTIETESRLGTLNQEQCTQFCSKDELWEAARKEEMKIPWKDAHEMANRKRGFLALGKRFGNLLRLISLLAFLFPSKIWRFLLARASVIFKARGSEVRFASFR